MIGRDAAIEQSQVPNCLSVRETIVVQSGVDEPARARTVPEVYASNCDGVIFPANVQDKGNLVLQF
ncbi:hypothetical protein Pyn_18674 [Prunus yedoensis var. nudiflora]|uniref:Uncharacterized protein n=1 Tax=Prunus yedoensis var. nudiflora TaxID=2094558 RepID=A0A314Y4H7_PRUYE|nr:hypothetical protein Pyn_18674 [Prunus yedoensis var. nudiflora]